MAAAIEILDNGGESALTFKALAQALSTGAGAIYWHVPDKSALLSAATERMLAEATARKGTSSDPAEALRTLALGVFDAIEAHPWIGTQLAREPWQPAMVPIFEESSAQFEALGIAPLALFHSVSALIQYLLGSAAQTAAAERHDFAASDRPAILATIVGEWIQRDPEHYPFVHRLAEQVRTHDDREAFIVGVDLIIDGAKILGLNGEAAGKQPRTR